MVICTTEGCKSKATYGFTFGNPEYCIAHGKEKGAKRQYGVCVCGLSTPRFAAEGEKASCCAKCKKNTMKNIKAKICICGKAQASFGPITDKTPTCCFNCKSASMVNLVGDKCICGKGRPSFGLSTDKKATCCLECKSASMVNLRSVKCKCGRKSASFGHSTDKKAICCVKCKSNTMINVVTKKCKCGKSQPVFGMKGDKRATCCVSCKTESMLDVVSAKCPGLINYELKGPIECPYSHRINKKFDNYCTLCFAQNFPNDPRTALINSKSHELLVKNYLSTDYGYFIHDKSLWTGQADCTCRRRIDFRTMIGNTLLCIEVDERQHKDRDEEDETLRYDDLMMLHGGKFVFIRYNPDLYIDIDGNRKNPSTITRFLRLRQEIETQMKRIRAEQNTELLEVVHLFYDE